MEKGKKNKHDIYLSKYFLEFMQMYEFVINILFIMLYGLWNKSTRELYYTTEIFRLFSLL